MLSIFEIAGSPYRIQNGCSFLAYSWKLSAYSGAFLLTVDNFSFFTYNLSFFAYSCSFFCLQWESASHKGLNGL